MNDIRLDTPSRRAIRTGQILRVLVAAFLILASALPKLIRHPSATDYFTHFGFDAMSTTVPIGMLEASIAILFLVPRTSVLGAILLTGLLGGAAATQLRVGDPIFFPIMVGGVAWLSLYLQDGRVRDLIRTGPTALPSAGVTGPARVV